MERNKTLNAIGCVFAAVVSVLLVVALVIAPFSSALTKLVSPKRLAALAVDAVKEFDVEDFVTDDIKESLDKWGLDTDVINNIMETDAVEEIMQYFADDTVKIIRDSSYISQLDADHIEEIVDENIDGILTVMETALEDAGVEDYDMDEIEKDAREIVSTYSGQVVNSLNSALTMGEVETDDYIYIIDRETVDGLFSVVNFLSSGKLLWCTIGVIAALIALLFVCRWDAQKGFFWLFIVNAVGFVANICVRLGFGAVESYVVYSVPYGTEPIAIEVLNRVAIEFTRMSVALAIVTALCFGAYYLCKKFSF